MLEQYDINWKDYYAVLGVGSSAEQEVVKAAYSALAKKYHPDAGGNAVRMKDINEAYEVLSDAAKKARYDVVYQERLKKSEAQRSYRYQSNTYQRQGHSTSSTGGYSYDSYEGQRDSERRQQATQSPPVQEKLLPWPSWHWQRIALFFSFPTTLFLMFVIHNVGATVLGLFLLVAAIYACARTRCLNEVKRASMVTKLAAGFNIVLGFGGMGLAAVLIGMPLAIIGLLVLPLFAIGRSQKQFN